MKKIKTARKDKQLVVPQHGYIRRLIRLIFGSLMKRQKDDDRQEIRRITEKMQNLEDLIKSQRVTPNKMTSRSRRRGS